MVDLTEPRALLKLIEDSGQAFCVIEQAVGSLRQRIATIDPADADVVAILHAHLLSVGSPTDIAKYFSMEMLEQSASGPLVFGLAIHANIVGQPFRLRQLRRALSHIAGLSDRIWVTRAGDIAAHIHEGNGEAV